MYGVPGFSAVDRPPVAVFTPADGPDRSWRALVLLGLFVGVASGCLPELPELTALDGWVDPRPRLSEPVVWVAEPEENASIPRSVLFSAKGFAVSFDGEFTPGHEIHLLAGRIETPDVGFSIQRIPIVDTVTPGVAYVRTEPSLLWNSRQIRLKLRLRDEDASLVSIDSVTLRIR